MKRFCIFFGVFLIFFALFTIIPNTIVGFYGLFASNFLPNIIHFLIGSALIFSVYYFTSHTSRVIHISGVTMLVLAVLGSWFVGDNTGKVFGVLLTNGPMNILHLVLGSLFVIYATCLERHGSHTEVHSAHDSHHE